MEGSDRQRNCAGWSGPTAFVASAVVVVFVEFGG